MGGAQRYPSIMSQQALGIAALHPSYESYRVTSSQMSAIPIKISRRKIFWVLGIAVGVAFVLDILGGFTIIGHYLTAPSQKSLSFSFRSCDTANEEDRDVVSREWQGDTLVLTGTAFPNCAATWLFGSYEVAGNKLRLKYSPVQGPWAMGCICAKKVRHEIQSLRVADYDVSISSGDVIRYMPLAARLVSSPHAPPQ